MKFSQWPDPYLYWRLANHTYITATSPPKSRNKHKNKNLHMFRAARNMTIDLAAR